MGTEEWPANVDSGRFYHSPQYLIIISSYQHWQAEYVVIYINARYFQHPNGTGLLPCVQFHPAFASALRS